MSLAAQTLSSSVAVALDFLRELQIPQFQESGATSDFIKVIDRIFDMLNVRVPFNKGYKEPLTTSNFQRLKASSEYLANYLLHLEDPHGNLIVTTRKSTGFIGFVVCLRSLFDVSEYLLQDRSIKYVLSYSFSQDHIELFFNAIRRACGWNDNPTALQFKSVYKRFLARAGVEPTSKGNCVNFGDVVETSPIEDDFLLVQPHNFNPFVSSVTTYIAGFVVRKVLPLVQCSECRFHLLSADTSSIDPTDRHLLVLKNKGGLTVPSRDVIRLLKTAESVFRENVSVKKMNYSRVFNLVMLGSTNIFGHEHFNESPLHAYSLMQSLVLAFLNIRGRHFAHCRNVQEVSKRYRLSRQIIFESM